MIDNEGFRLNVGIILANNQGQLFWGRRIGKQDAWQFPQGGMYVNETPTQTMYRELNEELGLVSKDVRILGSTQEWLSYRLPKHLLRHNSRPLCIGQKQKWFLLRLLADGTAIHFDSCGSPEFSTWRWVDYWHPLQQVISFKKNVYQQVLTEFKPLIKPYQPRLK